MSLTIVVLSASNLPNLETIGKIDPYVNIQFKGVTKKTSVKTGELNPQWNETLLFDFRGLPISEQDELKILVKDRELVGHNRLVGMYTMLMRDVMRCGPDQDVTLDINLSDINNRPLGATLTMKLKFISASSVQMAGREIGDGQIGNIIN